MIITLATVECVKTLLHIIFHYLSFFLPLCAPDLQSLLFLTTLVGYIHAARRNLVCVSGVVCVCLPSAWCVCLCVYLCASVCVCVCVCMCVLSGAVSQLMQNVTQIFPQTPHLSVSFEHPPLQPPTNTHTYKYMGN